MLPRILARFSYGCFICRLNGYSCSLHLASPGIGTVAHPRDPQTPKPQIRTVGHGQGQVENTVESL